MQEVNTNNQDLDNHVNCKRGMCFWAYCVSEVCGGHLGSVNAWFGNVAGSESLNPEWVVTMASKRKYAWETNDHHTAVWDEEGPGLSQFRQSDAESESEQEQEADPSEALLNFLVSEHDRGALSAKQLCVVAYRCGQAGLQKLAAWGLPPDTKGTGDFKRLVDKQTMRAEGGDRMPNFYFMNGPFYSRNMGNIEMDLPVVLLHEALLRELEGKNLARLHGAWSAPPHYASHPVVREAVAAGKPAVPISLSMELCKFWAAKMVGFGKSHV